MANTVTSLYNKIIVLIEGIVSNLDWFEGVRKYTMKKGLLTSDESLNGLPDSDDESEEAQEDRRQAGLPEV